MKNFWNKIILPGCCYFTVLTFCFAAVNYMLYSGTPGGAGLASDRVILFLVFSFILATANTLVKNENISGFVRLVLHAVIVGLAFLLCMILPLGIGAKSAMIGMLIFYFLYAVAAFFIISGINRSKRRKNDDADYKPIISNKNND